MKRQGYLLLLAFASLLLSSCLPEDRVWWSPKGDRAVVSISDTLHLVQADGELGPPLAGGLSLHDIWIKTVTWLPDGSGFVCQRVRRCKTWAEARALIPEEEALAIERLAPQIPPLLQVVVKLAEGMKQLDDLHDVEATLPIVKKKSFAVALLRAYQQDPAVIEKLLLALPDGGKIIEDLKGDAMFEVGELCLVKLGGEPQQLTNSWSRSLLRPALMPRLSPKHAVVACLRLDEQEENATLEVLPLDGAPGVIVSQNLSAAFDWTPDGRSLVFMAPMGEKGEKLQAIHRLTVVREDASLIRPQADDKEPDKEMNAVTLATAVTLDRQALQVLPDGRVLFASQPVSLPAAGAVLELNPRLYTISADGKTVQPVPTADGDLPANLGYFTASPDGRYVAVVESGTDAVAVVEITSGRTQIISPPHKDWECKTIPAWKSATELTFAALHGPANQPKWMLWSEDTGVRCISDKWPAEATAGWLKKREAPQNESVPLSAKPSSPR